MSVSRTDRLRQIPLPGMDDRRSGYRGPAACRIVGVTYRQLDYWTTTGLVRSSVRDADGSGSQRLYSFDDIVQLKVVKRLLDAGVHLNRIRQAIEFVRDRGLSLRDVTLVSDGSTVYALDGEQQVVDLLQSGQGVFAITVSPVYAETEADLASVPAERVAPALQAVSAIRAAAS